MSESGFKCEFVSAKSSQCTAPYWVKIQLDANWDAVLVSFRKEELVRTVYTCSIRA